MLNIFFVKIVVLSCEYLKETDYPNASYNTQSVTYLIYVYTIYNVRKL